MSMILPAIGGLLISQAATNMEKDKETSTLATTLGSLAGFTGAVVGLQLPKELQIPVTILSLSFTAFMLNKASISETNKQIRLNSSIFSAKFQDQSLETNNLRNLAITSLGLTLIGGGALLGGSAMLSTMAFPAVGFIAGQVGNMIKIHSERERAQELNRSFRI